VTLRKTHQLQRIVAKATHKLNSKCQLGVTSLKLTMKKWMGAIKITRTIAWSAPKPHAWRGNNWPSMNTSDFSKRLTDKNMYRSAASRCSEEGTAPCPSSPASLSSASCSGFSSPFLQTLRGKNKTRVGSLVSAL